MLSESDIHRISRYIGLSYDDFIAQFTDKAIWLRFSQRVLLSDINKTGCVFLSDAGCAVYPVRPVRCATFPRKDQIDDELIRICERAKKMNLNSVTHSAIEVFKNCAFRFFDGGGYGINFKNNKYYFLDDIGARLVHDIISTRAVDTKSIANEYGVQESLVIDDAVVFLKKLALPDLTLIEKSFTRSHLEHILRYTLTAKSA